MPQSFTLPPDLAAQQDQISLQQALAQQMMQKAQRGADMEGWNQMKIVPKLGIGGALVGAGNTMAAALMAKTALAHQRDFNRQVYGMGQNELDAGIGGGGNQVTPGIPLQPAPPSDPSEGPQPLINRPNGQTLAETLAATQSQGGGKPDYNTALRHLNSAVRLGAISPELAKEYLATLAPTDLEKTARIAGANPQPYAAASLNKGATLEMRPGGSAFNLMTGQMQTAPDPSKGLQFSGSGADGTLRAAAIPGVAEQAGNMQGYETAAKVANTPLTFPTGGGGTGLGYPGRIPGLGVPPAAAGAPGPGQPSPVRVARPEAPLAMPSAPGGQPAKSANDPWANMPKMDIPTGLSTPNAFQANVLKDSATKHAELATKYGAESDLADQKLQYNSEALKALPSAEVGPLSHYLTQNRAALAELSPSLAKVMGGSGSVAPTQELNKNLVNAALQGARAIYGARMTQNEVNLQKNEASPSAAMAPDAIKSLLIQDNIRNQYGKQRADDYGKYIKSGGDPMRFESWYSSKFPLKTFALKSQTPPGALQMLQQHPETAEQFKSKFGWLPNE